MLNVVQGCEMTIKKYDQAVEKFDNKMMGVSTREAKRIEAEHQHAMAIAANAGKELDFFEDPDLLTEKRAIARDQRSRPASACKDSK